MMRHMRRDGRLAVTFGPVLALILCAMLFSVAVPMVEGLHVVQPKNDTVVHELPVMFGWDCEQEVEYYMFIIADSGDLSGQYMERNLTDPYISLQTLNQGEWYWRVKAYSEGEVVAQSDIHSLTYRTIPDDIHLEAHTSSYEENGKVSFSVQPLDYDSITLTVASQAGEQVHEDAVTDSPVSVSIPEEGAYTAFVNATISDVSHSDTAGFELDAPPPTQGNATSDTDTTGDSGGDENASGMHALNVTVYDGEGAVDGANLTCAASLSTLSDSDGEARLVMDEGTYTCTLLKEGYLNETFGVSLDADTQMNHVLEKADEGSEVQSEGAVEENATGSDTDVNDTAPGQNTSSGSMHVGTTMHGGAQDASSRGTLEVRITRSIDQKTPPVEIAYNVSRNTGCELLVSREGGNYEIVGEGSGAYTMTAGMDSFILFEMPAGNYQAKVRCDGVSSDPIDFTITSLGGRKLLQERIKRLQQVMEEESLAGLSSFDFLSEEIKDAKGSLKEFRENLKGLREKGNVSGYRSTLQVADTKARSMLQRLPSNITVEPHDERVFYLPRQGFTTLMEGYLRTDPALVRETKNALHEKLPGFQEHFVASRKSRVVCAVYDGDDRECYTLVTKEVRPENKSIRRNNVVMVEFVPGEVAEVHGAEKLRDGYLKGDMGSLSIMYVLGGKTGVSVLEETRTLVSYHHELSDPPVVTGRSVSEGGSGFLDISTLLLSLIIVAVVGVMGLLFMPGSPACLLPDTGSAEERLQSTLNDAITLMERQGPEEALPQCSRALSLFERVPPERKGEYMELMEQVSMYLERYSLDEKMGMLLEKLRFQEKLAAFDSHLFAESERLFNEITAGMQNLPPGYREQLSEKMRMIRSLRAKIESRRNA